MSIVVGIFGTHTCVSQTQGCVVDQVSYIGVSSSHHCTSNKVYSTRVSLIPAIVGTSHGVYEWKCRIDSNCSWISLGSQWNIDNSNGNAEHLSFSHNENTREYLLVFIQDSTGCKDSSVVKVVLDDPPLIEVYTDTINGICVSIVQNSANPSGEGDEILWIDCNGVVVSTNDTLEEENACIVKVNNCIGCVDTMGVRHLCANKDIFPYPNPAYEFILFSTQGKCDISLFDITGRCVFRKQANQGEVKIDISSYSGGVYVLRVCERSSFMIIEH